MKIFQISCYSECGSYFVSYLKSVTVKANSAEQAKTVVKAWLIKTEREFIAPEDKWEITCQGDDTSSPSVIDYEESSDY